MHRFGLVFSLLVVMCAHVSAQSDIACSAIVSPTVSATSCSNTFTTTELITVNYANVGLTMFSAGTIISIDVSLDGVSVLSEIDTLPIALGVGAQNMFTTIGVVDMSAPGAHVLTVTCTTVGDVNSANDTLALPYSDQALTFGYIENFDSLPSNNSSATMTVFDVPAGWENVVSDAAGLAGNIEPNWGPNNGATASIGGGPAGDNTSGNGIYMYIEDSQNQPGAIELRTPCFSTAGAVGNPTISFANFSDQFSSSTSDNLLRLDVINVTAGGTVTLNVNTFPGAGVSNWRLLQVDLSAFAPDIIRVQFRTNNDNVNFNDDEAIDDVAFLDQVASTGQAPQPGTAVFDINNSLNINSAPVSSFQAGPFFTSASAGGQLVFTMNGESNQPIVMLTGPLNIAAATFGSIGQFDIGGFPGPNGIPAGLSLVVDGTAPGLLNSLFVLDTAGQADVGVTVPVLPFGVLGTFQCAMLRAGPQGIAFSNAIEITIN